MIHAYNEMYLYGVMKNLAALVDLAINAEGLDADRFGEMFSSSDVAKKIEHGYPDMLAGKSASEMLSIILKKQVNYSSVPMDRTPEYWAGWILAKAQWTIGKSFEEILDVMPLSSLIELYYLYHEAFSMYPTIDHYHFDVIQSKVHLKHTKPQITHYQFGTPNEFFVLHHRIMFPPYATKLNTPNQHFPRNEVCL